MNITPAVGQAESHEFKMAEWTRHIKRSVLREMLAVVSRPGILSFAGGLPAPELFPTKEFAEAAERALSSDPTTLQYGPPYPPLKSHIVDLMLQRRVKCSEEQIFITTGAQQALNVVTRQLLDRGDAVLVEELVYTGIQQALAGYDAKVLTVPTDLDHGMNVDAVERHLLSGYRPAYIYAIPESHNPIGVSLAADREQQLVGFAREYGIPIVEDDPYGWLSYDDSATALPMRSMDEEWVIYISSFSKILAPALRLGWMVVPERLIPTLTVLKEALDLETSAFIQRSVAAYLDAGHLPFHLARLKNAYRQRRDTMLAAIAEHFPDSARWTRPTGGMFIWVELPAHVNTASLLWTAVEQESVAYIPGSAFSVSSGILGSGLDSPAENCLRLNFSNSSPEEIADGIERLGRLLHGYC